MMIHPPTCCPHQLHKETTPTWGGLHVECFNKEGLGKFVRFQGSDVVGILVFEHEQVGGNFMLLDSSFPLRLLCVAWGVVRKCIALNELPWNAFVCLKD